MSTSTSMSLAAIVSVCFLVYSLGNLHGTLQTIPVPLPGSGLWSIYIIVAF